MITSNLTVLHVPQDRSVDNGVVRAADRTKWGLYWTGGNVNGTAHSRRCRRESRELVRMGLTQPPIECVLAGGFLGVKLPGRVADHYSDAKVRNR